MAQNIQLPLSVDLICHRRQWEPCIVVIEGLAGPILRSRKTKVMGGPKDDDVVFSLKPSKPRTKLENFYDGKLYFDSSQLQPSGLGYMDLQGKYVSDGVIKTDELGEYPSFEILISSNREASGTVRKDPWAMREEFFGLDQSAEALAQFLKNWSSWADTQVIPDFDIGLLNWDFNEAPVYLIPDVVWEQRAKYKEALSASPRSWLSRGNVLPAPHSQLKPPYFAMSDHLCSSAIETTITLDHLRGIPYRLCERADCGNVFTLESRHERRFCSQSCAHLVSVRRGREAKRNKVKKGKR